MAKFSIFLSFLFLSDSKTVPHLDITYEELLDILYSDSVVSCHDTLFDLPFYYIGMWVVVICFLLTQRFIHWLLIHAYMHSHKHKCLFVMSAYKIYGICTYTNTIVMRKLIPLREHYVGRQLKYATLISAWDIVVNLCCRSDGVDLELGNLTANDTQPEVNRTGFLGQCQRSVSKFCL